MTLAETLISSFSVMFVSSITWLAYKHHDAYKKVFPQILKTGVVILLLISAYDTGIMMSHISVSKFGNIKEYNEIKKAIESNLLPYFAPWGIFMALMLYFFFLNFLPDIIKDLNKVKPENP